ncbi:MAG: GDP-mannose 4,6-dehydratase, partial [Methanomassiliicoccales archaeon]|nr:GDP-mannose 4,6-dehydratase [Methanomassiliicoccales archaeon]
MIISKTPLRVSFAGGGTDIADYYRTGYGAVVSSAIRKYVYVTVNKRFDDDIRISYAKTEIVDSVDKIEHGLVREALRKVGIRNGIEITTIADIPSRGTGLGSSSAIAVGLLNALYAFKGYRASPKKLAEEACEVAGVKDPDRVVKMNPDYMRPADFTNLRGDATKAKLVLGWTPKVRFKELARIMVEADL